MKTKGSEQGGYRHLAAFRAGRPPAFAWRFLAILFQAYCDHRPYCRMSSAWRYAWRDARAFFARSSRR